MTVTLGNSVYLGTKSSATASKSATAEAIQLAQDQGDTEALASDEYKNAATDEAKNAIKQKYEAKYIHAANIAAMDKDGISAGVTNYDTDYTYGNDSSCNYAGSQADGIVTVGSKDATRRIQNVSAGLVGPTSTDAVNGSQLYALTRQIRFGGDNSSFGTTAADDQNVVARGSNEAISITGGSDAVTSSNVDGKTTNTVDTAKLTGNNIAVVADADKNALHVQLASNLKDLNTAQLGSGSGDSYKGTIKLDGTGTTGGQMTLAGADGTVKTTLDTTGLTVANGPKFTSSGIDAASKKINHVTAGTDDADAANVGQVNAAAAEATTEVKAGTNASLGTVETSAADKHKIYTVNVDNLAVKANGTGTTTVALANGINFKNGTNTTSDVDSNGNVTIDTKNLNLKANGTNTATVTMDNGINFKNGTNTTATVGTDGTVTISASHNKLDSASYTASKSSDSSNQTTVKLKDTDNNETTLNLTDTYTNVSKNTDHTITFKRNDGSTPVSISLDDLNGASKKALTTAAAKATTTVIQGNNVDRVEDDTTSADGHHIYKINVSNLGVKVADGQKKSVALSDGLVFGNGTNTTASVGDNGAITFNVSNDAIKTQAKDAINMSAGSNVKVETASTDGLSKTFTISATHNALKSATLMPKSNDVSTLTIIGNDGDSASVDIENTHLTVSKDSTAKTVTFTSNDGITPPTTLSLSDFGAASTTDMTAAAAKATTEVKAGINATLGTLETDPTDQHKIYTVNVDNLGLKQNGTTVGTGTGVSLKNGLNFSNGTNTTANVTENGTVSYSVSNDAIKAQAKDAVVVAAGDNVSIDTPTDANNVKTYTVKVNDLKLQANGEDKGTRKLAEGINFADGKNTTATVEDGKVIYRLNDTLTGLTSMTAKDTAGNQTLVSGSGVTITPAAAGAQSISLTTNGLSMGGQQITNVQSGGDTDTNAANISDVKRLVQASASGTTETGFNVKGDDATAQKVKLGKQLNVIGGTNKAEELSDNNIGVVTTADAEGNATLTVKLNKDITLDSVTTGSTTLNTSGVSNGDMSLTNTGLVIKNNDDSKQVSVTTSGVSMGSQRIQNVADATRDTDAATLKQVKNARTVVAGGSNVAGVTPAEGANNQMTYTVNVDNLSVKANSEEAKSVTLKNGLTFNDGTNTTASVGEGGVVSFGLKPEISLTKVTTGSSTLDTNGLTISGGPKIVASGIDAGNKVISGVANGSNDTDAVNVSQLKAIQSDVDAGWTIKGKDSTNADVNANIGKGKSVTYSNGNYTKAVVTKDDSGNATVTVDVTTGILTTGTDGKITSADGLATTGAVASAVNGASWTIQDGSHTGNAQQVKAGDTVSFKAGDNLTLDQVGREFTYKLNQTLTNMNSVTAVDDKQNTAVLNGEGLKVTDAQGNALTQHATEVRLHDASRAADDTTTDVVLNKQGLQNGGHTITGVADGKVVAGSQEAVNGGQLYDLQQKVGSGWKITGNNTDSTTSIGADKTVSFVNGKNSTVTVSGSDSGATVKVDVDTATLAVKDSRAVATGSGVADASQVAEAINNAAWTVEKAGSEAQAQKVKTGTTVTFGNDENLTLAQNGTAFTYGLASNVNISTIRLGGTKGADDVWTGSIYIGKQMGGGANSNDGNYITGLDNTSWDLSKVVDNRAATEGQLKAAINQVTIASQSGGFGLRDEKGSTVSQMLGQTVGIIGDTEYEADGKTVKQQGNITTEADSTNAGAVKVKLNKNLDLTEQGSVTMGTTTLTSGQAKVGQITVNGTDNTVSGLANTSWDEATAKADGYKGSTKAATESQLQAVYTQATTTASANEQHIQAGTYDVMTQSDANGKKQNSVTMNIVDGSGNTKGQVVINDVAKASDLGDTTALNSDIQNKNGSTSVVDAVNNLNGKVGDNRYLDVTGKEIQNGDSSTTAIGKLNNRMNDIYSKATQHSTVTKADDNVTIQTSTNADGGTNYQIGLNKENIGLGKVTIQGNEGSITAKSMKADTFTAGNTVVNKDGVKVGDKSALTGDKLTVGGKDYVTSDGINANGKAIGNVGEGKNDTDAVNVKQVNDLAARQGEAITENAAHIGELGRAVNKLGNRLNRVGAGAAALAALHPGTYDPNDKWDFSAGIGHYHDANAVAIGAYYHPNDTTILSIGGSMGGGENMVNAGITWKMGRSGHEQRAAQPVVTHPVQAAPAVQQAAPVHPAPVVTPAPVTTPVPVKAVVPAMPAPAVTTAMTAAPSGDTAALTQILARQTAILEKLAQNQSQAARPTAVAHGDDIFPDVPENHWAYAYVAKLEKAGALKGFKRPAVLKSPMMTRDDFASVLYTAMANGATTNPALNGDDSLNRLAQEFKAELKDVKP